MNGKIFAVAFVAAAVGVGCRTTEDVLSDYEDKLEAGNYAGAVPEVKELAGKADSSQVLWRLLAGGAAYLADDKITALTEFDAAEDAFIAQDQTSVFAKGGEGALAMMTNDRAFPYDGGGQDRIFTCLYKAVDYISSGKKDAARTELNRAAQHQENWLWERRKDLQAAAEKMEADARTTEAQKGVKDSQRAAQSATILGDASFGAQIREKTGYDPSVSGNLETLARKDFYNTYAAHVCGVFRWLAGDGGSAFLRDVAALRPENAIVAADAAASQKGKPKNNVWIYVEDGLCPVREEWRLDLPLVLLPGVNRYVWYAGMALPVLVKREAGAQLYVVEAGGADKRYAVPELADMDHLLRTEYDVYMRGALAREVTRVLVKIGAQVAAGVIAENQGNDNARLALRLTQAGLATWAASTTAADLRCWTTLPKKVYMVRVPRPADGRITLWADSKRAVEFNVPEGNTLVFVRKPAPGAVPAIKQVTFAN